MSGPPARTAVGPEAHGSWCKHVYGDFAELTESRWELGEASGRNYRRLDNYSTISETCENSMQTRKRSVTNREINTRQNTRKVHFRKFGQKGQDRLEAKKKAR